MLRVFILSVFQFETISLKLQWSFKSFGDRSYQWWSHQLPRRPQHAEPANKTRKVTIINSVKPQKAFAMVYSSSFSGEKTMKTENDLGNQQFTVRTSKEKEFCSSLKLKVILVVSICPRQSLVFPLCPRSFCSRPLTRMPDYRDWRRSSRNYSQETIIIPVRWARWL